MAYFDGLTLLIIVLSAIIGMWGGFTQNILKILSFIIAIFIACRYYFLLSPFLSRYMHISQGLLNLCSGLLTALLTVIAGYLFTALINKLIQATPLSSLDHLLGLFLGVIVGIGVDFGIYLAAKWLLEPDAFRQLTAHSRLLPWFYRLHHYLIIWWSSNASLHP